MATNEIVVRAATEQDNAGLIALAKACPMNGDVELCVDRAPDFFALNRLEGENWHVGVVEQDGKIIGCGGGALRKVYFQGKEMKMMYTGDLKVHPDYRKGKIADAIIRYIYDYCEKTLGKDCAVLSTILAGNAAMEKRLPGGPGLPTFTKFATIRAHSIQLLWKRAMPKNSAVTVRRATASDLPAMTSLWAKSARDRQFSFSYSDGKDFGAWMKKAPGLDFSSYWVAVDNKDGSIKAFMALWDQDVFKHMYVMSYSPKLKVIRAFFNFMAPFFKAAKLPPAGGAMRYLTAAHICVENNNVDIFRAVVISAYNDLRGKGYSFFSVGLDLQDPLTAAMQGLMAEPSNIHAYMSSPSGTYAGTLEELTKLPLQFEIALV